jgi:hypothetical protein
MLHLLVVEGEGFREFGRRVQRLEHVHILYKPQTSFRNDIRVLEFLSHFSAGNVFGLRGTCICFPATEYRRTAAIPHPVSMKLRPGSKFTGFSHDSRGSTCTVRSRSAHGHSLSAREYIVFKSVSCNDASHRSAGIL